MTALGLHALQHRLHRTNTDQLVMTVHDAVDAVVGQVLARRMAADHHGLVQAGLAYFGDEAFLGQRALEVVVRAAGADAAVEPARHVVLG